MQIRSGMFLHFTDGVLSGIICLHVDDILLAGTSNFAASVIRTMNEKFQIGSNEMKNFKYVGVNVRNSKHAIELDQENYIQNLH